MSAAHRARELVRNTALAATTSADLAREDPAAFAIQVSRRLPPGVVRAVSAGLLRITGGRASTLTLVAQWLAGRRADARRTLDALADRPSTRVRSELAVELGVPQLAPDGSVAARARALWTAGAVDDAIAAASGRPALQRRLISERRVMSPGNALPAQPGTRVRGSGPSALHLLTNSLPHTASGYTLRSHHVLRAQQEAGIRVLAATRSGYPVSVGLLRARDEDVVDGVRYRRLLPRRAARTIEGRLEQAVQLARPVVAHHRPAVIHTTTHYVNGLVAQSLAREHGLPWVYEVRGLLEETWVASRPTEEAREQAGASQRHTLLRAREAELAGAADHVVTLNETVLADLVARGVDVRTVTVVPNSVDSGLLSVDVRSDDARAALGLPTDGFWVGTVSSLVDYEGIDTLVLAVAQLRRRGVDVRAAIVGDGVARPALSRLVHELGLADHVVMPGRVPRSEAIRWHCALDAFVVPRRDDTVCRMVTPLKPLEAMALRRPVVASALPALDEIVATAGTGLSVAPGDAEALADAVAVLAADRSLAATFGETGREFAATRTWARAGRTYRALYERLREEVAA